MIEPLLKNWHFKDLKSGFNKNITERYYLVIINEKKSAQGVLVVFMMNPSHAGSNQNKKHIDYNISDRTVNRIINTIGANYKRVLILNNIPEINSNSNEIIKQKNIVCLLIR